MIEVIGMLAANLPYDRIVEDLHKATGSYLSTPDALSSEKESKKDEIMFHTVLLGLHEQYEGKNMNQILNDVQKVKEMSSLMDRMSGKLQ